MTSDTLTDVFALLLREHEGQGAARNSGLSAAAAHAIRRRVAARWAGRIGALVVVGGLGVAALPGNHDAGTHDAGGKGGADDTRETSSSPTPTPVFGFADATFPLTGGPEFVPASAALTCGDPVPAPHPIDNELNLTIGLGTVFTLGNEGDDAGPPTIQAVVKETTASDKGSVSTSGIDFLVVKDGIIRGIIGGSGVGLIQNVVGGTVSTPQSGLLADAAYCPDGTQRLPAGIGQGPYDVVAVGRVFSTPESVALTQALGGTINIMYLNPNDRADPAAVYLPGQYDCKRAREWAAALRGCLPEITSRAAVDEAEGTVTVTYVVKGLVEEFSVVLVSEPLTVELVSGQDATPAAA